MSFAFQSVKQPASRCVGCLLLMGCVWDIAHAERTIEVPDLVKMFLQSSGGPAVLGDWTTGAREGSVIRWETSGIERSWPSMERAGYPYQRIGHVILTVNGKPTHEVLKKMVTPGEWIIQLLGPRGGYTRVIIGSGIAYGLGPMLESFTNALPSQHYRCKPQSVSSGNNVYAVQVPGRQIVWLNESWSCGSAGCSVMWDIVFTRNEADAFECV